jgi:hypothetical protein
VRRLKRYLSKVGGGFPEFEIWPKTTAPVFVGHIRPTAEPTLTGAKGDFYFDSTANCLMQHNGSAWVRVGASLDDLAISDDLTVGDDITLTSAGAVLTFGTTNPAVLTGGTNLLTLAASDTLAITTADLLTVGGVIVPQFGYIAARVGPHASVTEYDLFVAPRALQVTRIDVVPSTLQGGALTATIVKAVGTDTPVKTTTPMHTADAINLNTGAYTVQNITLTVTTADLQLAAGNRISIDYSAALTAGHAAVTISFKYI